MPRNPLITMAQRGWLAPMLELGRLGAPYYRVTFRGAGLRSGILYEVHQQPATASALAARLGISETMVDGLAAWLDAGVTFGELSKKDGIYSIRRRSLKRLLKPSNDPVAAFTEEMATLQHSLLLDVPQALREGRWLPVADADPETIARSSKVGEPWVRAALEDYVPRDRQARLLDIGCGSGIHIRTSCSLNSRLTAVGVELHEPAAELARQSISEWGLDDRVEIISGDVRDLEPQSTFDLVTLHQNIYYFRDVEQVALLEHVRTFLNPGGTLLITSIIRDSGISSATLDLWGAVSEGTSRLPIPEELVSRMQKAGFADARYQKLGSEKLYGAFIGTAS